MKMFVKGSIAAMVIGGLGLAAFGQEVKDVTAPQAAPAAIEAQTVTVTVEEAQVALATEVESIGMVGDDVVIRFTKDAEFWPLPATSLEAMCWKDRVLELTDIPGLAPIMMSVKDGTLTIGSNSIEIDCPLPGGYEDLGWLWAQRAAEHAMDGEFTDAHLRAMIATMEKAEPVLFTPQRVKGYTTGGDHRMVVAALEQHLGQFKAYVLEVDNLMYIVPMTETLAACGSNLCNEPRLVVWHLHKQVHVAKKKKKKASPPRESTTTITPAPHEDPYRTVCVAPCN